MGYSINELQKYIAAQLNDDGDRMIRAKQIIDVCYQSCNEQRVESNTGQGLADAIEEQLNQHDEWIYREEEYIKSLEKKIDFCGEHKFNEEKRIALVEWSKSSMIVHRWREMYKDIQTIIDKWNS